MLQVGFYLLARPNTAPRAPSRYFMKEYTEQDIYTRQQFMQ